MSESNHLITVDYSPQSDPNQAIPSVAETEPLQESHSSSSKLENFSSELEKSNVFAGAPK